MSHVIITEAQIEAWASAVGIAAAPRDTDACCCENGHEPVNGFVFTNAGCIFHGIKSAVVARKAAEPAEGVTRERTKWRGGAE